MNGKKRKEKGREKGIFENGGLKIFSGPTPSFLSPKILLFLD